MTNRIRMFGATILVFGLAACGPGEDPAPAPAPEEAAEPTADLIAQGEELFLGAGNCTVCHGSDAQGASGFGPDLTDGSWIWLDQTSPTLWDDIAEVVQAGIDDPQEFDSPMPAMGGGNLDEDEVRAVAAYLYSLN